MATKVLVVDDDPDILDAIQFILEDNGYIVQAGKKGELAENLIAKNTSLPDLIILDVLLSGKDGRSICKKLKENRKTKKIPIIMISAHPSIENSVKEAGANAFFAKPFDVYRLLERVSTYVH